MRESLDKPRPAMLFEVRPLDFYSESIFAGSLRTTKAIQTVSPFSLFISCRTRLGGARVPASREGKRKTLEHNRSITNRPDLTASGFQGCKTLFYRMMVHYNARILQNFRKSQVFFSAFRDNWDALKS